MRDKVKKGDFLFFHTNRKGKHVISAYYVIEKVMPTEDARKDKLIVSKHRNPHLFRKETYNYDTIVFGNPIYSKIVKDPFEIHMAILDRLSRKHKSISRPWVKLSNEDVKFLLSEINNWEKQGFLKDTFLPSTEVEQVSEEDIESFIERNPHALDKNLENVRTPIHTQLG